jgi:hypothetical protein
MTLPLMRMTTREQFQITFAGIGQGDKMLFFLHHSNVQCTGGAASKSLSGPLYMPIQPTSTARNTKIIYGGDSWIGAEDYSASTKSTLFTETIPDTGHQVYANQFQHFMAAVLRALERHHVLAGTSTVEPQF